MVACTPYAAQIASPLNMAERRLRAALKTAMRGWGWAPWWLPVAVGLLLGARGSPRCPLAAAVGAVIFPDGSWWGPPALLNLAGPTWRRIE
eukprot:2498972-Alexandrium_andersonii.AAC.1